MTMHCAVTYCNETNQLKYLNIMNIVCLLHVLLSWRWTWWYRAVWKMDVTCYFEMMVPLPIFARCHKLEDYRHTYNFGARGSAVIRVTPPSHYICRKRPHFWLDRKLGGFRIRRIRLTGWRQKNLVRFPTEVKEFLFFKAYRPAP